MTRKQHHDLWAWMLGCFSRDWLTATPEATVQETIAQVHTIARLESQIGLLPAGIYDPHNPLATAVAVCKWLG